MTAPKPVSEDLFTWPSDEPRLIGSECTDCSLISFPAADHCVRCGGTDSRRRLLSNRGTLWTFTTQGFRPPSPPYDATDLDSFEPYSVGYIELPGEVLVEARLTEPDPEKLAIGQSMRMVATPYTVADDGTETLTFAFAPADDADDAEEA